MGPPWRGSLSYSIRRRSLPWKNYIKKACFNLRIHGGYRAWVSLKVKAKQLATTVYQVKPSQLSDYLVNQLYYPTIPAV